MNQLKINGFLIALILGFSLSATAQAVPPHLPDLVSDGNRWTITFYDDSSPIHRQWTTQGICFFNDGVGGTHQRYSWASDTYPDWNGRATQEGDQVFMHGDFQWPFGIKDGGHDGMEWEILSGRPRNQGAGHWKEWVEDGKLGQTIGFGNARLERVGKCQFVSFSEALKKGFSLQQPFNEKGELLTNPMGINEKGDDLTPPTPPKFGVIE